MMKNLIFILFVALSFSASAQNDSVWAARAAAITAGCKTPYEKAKAIYRWECANLDYDFGMTIRSAGECWDQRKGVCEAISGLYYKLACFSGVDATILSGVGKGMGTGSHAWIAVKIGKRTVLIEPTWGAQSSRDSSDIFMGWFDVKPELMVFTHFPEDEKDQHLAKPITYEQFQSLPKMESFVVKAGWDASVLLNYFLKHPGSKPPMFFTPDTQYGDIVRFVSIPYERQLKPGKTYTFKIKVTNSKYKITSNHGNWSRKGNLFTMTYRAKEGEKLSIYVNNNGVLGYKTE